MIKNKEEISNEDYNFLMVRMRGLEETYKQCIDAKVRNIVKEKIFCEICIRFPTFFECYGDYFQQCKMSSLKEICDLIDLVNSKYVVKRMPYIREKQIMKILKLKEKSLKAFVKDYNNAIEGKNLTYYSKKMDDKLVLLSQHDGELIGAVTQGFSFKGNKECLCYFCGKFRRGNEILFVTNSVRTAKGKYASIGQTICSDFELCNKNIEKKQNVIRFLSYGKQMKMLDKEIER